MRVLGVAAAMALLASCGDGATDQSSTQGFASTEGVSGVPHFVGPEECDDTAHVSDAGPSPSSSCAAGFLLEGTFYAVSCGPVRPETVTEEVIADGVYAGVPTELRRLAEVDPGLLVAIGRDGGVCGEGDEVLSPWSMVFPSQATQRPETRDAVCRVSLEEFLDRDQCGRAIAYVLHDRYENATIEFPDLVPLIVGVGSDEPAERIRAALVASTQPPDAMLTTGARPTLRRAAVPTVTVEGDLVVLDYASERASEELGIWSTSSGSTGMNAIIGMVFENAPGAQTVEQRLDGSCAHFTETMQGAGCQQNTRARWEQYKTMTRS